MSKAISRRDFLKVTGAVGAAGLLAACGGNGGAASSTASSAAEAASVAGLSSDPVTLTMTNVLTAFSCQRIFVFFYLLNSDITMGVVHNYAFSCIHRYIGCR